MSWQVQKLPHYKTIGKETKKRRESIYLVVADEKQKEAKIRTHCKGTPSQFNFFYVLNQIHGSKNKMVQGANKMKDTHSFLRSRLLERTPNFSISAANLRSFTCVFFLFFFFFSSTLSCSSPSSVFVIWTAGPALAFSFSIPFLFVLISASERGLWEWGMHRSR